MTLDKLDRRYVEETARILPNAMLGAYLINALILVACATSWKRFGTAVALQTVISAFNIAVNAAVQRYGARAEVWRGVGNGLMSGIA